MLGFLKRICYEFRDLKALTRIYIAHVRSHLEYASVIWNPIYNVHCEKIESVQKQFVICALRKSVRRDSEYRLTTLLRQIPTLGLESLARRRSNSSIFFVSKIIDVPHLFETFNSIRNVPAHTYGLRVLNIFRNIFHRTKYGTSEPVNTVWMLFKKKSAICTSMAFREELSGSKCECQTLLL